MKLYLAIIVSCWTLCWTPWAAAQPEISARKDSTKMQLPSIFMQKIKEALFAVNPELNQFITETIEKDSTLTTGVYAVNFPTLRPLQVKMPVGAVTLQYVFRDKALFIAAIGKTEQKVYCTDGSLVVGQIQQIRNLMKDDLFIQTMIRHKFIELSHQLYQTLIAPVTAQLADKTRLMIIPEGELFRLPFELLIENNADKPYHQLDYLIRRFEVNYHHAVNIYLQMQSKTPVKNNSMFAFAPVFDGGAEVSNGRRSLDKDDDLKGIIEEDHFVALPYTEREVKTIEKMIKREQGKVNLFLKKEATEKNAQKVNEQAYQFLHVATHGLITFKNKHLDYAIACYDNSTKFGKLIFPQKFNPQNIQIDLFIFSSCESATGMHSESLIAQNHTLKSAGAKNLMLSLWKISDKYSSELMIGFYKHYYAGKASYTSALRAAKLEMLKEPLGAQPKYWAAFVLMGE